MSHSRKVINLQQLYKIFGHVLQIEYLQLPEKNKLGHFSFSLSLPQINICSWLRKHMAKILACSFIIFFFLPFYFK